MRRNKLGAFCKNKSTKRNINTRRSAHTSDKDRNGFNQTVKSVGVGLQMPVRDRWVLDVSYARPLDKRSLDRSKPPGRLLVNLTARFF